MKTGTKTDDRQNDNLGSLSASRKQIIPNVLGNPYLDKLERNINSIVVDHNSFDQSPMAERALNLAKTFPDRLGELRVLGIRNEEEEIFPAALLDTEASKIFSQIWLRLRSETNYTKMYDSLKFGDAFVDGPPSRMRAHWIVVGEPNWLEEKLFDSCDGFQAPGLVRILSEWPQPSDFLTSMAQRGNLPPEVGVLVHELAHTFHSGVMYALKNYDLQKMTRLSLVESQARIITDMIPGASIPLSQLSDPVSRIITPIATDYLGTNTRFAENASGKATILGEVKDQYRLKSEIALKAFHDVKHLSLLGVSQEKIGRLIRGSQLDIETGEIQPLHQELDKVRTRLGLTDPTVFELVVKVLGIDQELSVRHDELTARRITREELEKHFKAERT